MTVFHGKNKTKWELQVERTQKTPTHAHLPMYAHTHTCTHTRTHAHMHACTHTCTHMYTHTHTHTHTHLDLKTESTRDKKWACKLKVPHKKISMQAKNNMDFFFP